MMFSTHTLALCAQALLVLGPILAAATEPLRLQPLRNGAWPGLGSGAALSVEVVGKYAYAVFGTGGLGIFDISEPTNIQAVGGSGPMGNPTQIRVVGRYAYMATGQAGMQVFDVSNPSRPLRRGQYLSEDILSVDVVGSYAYVGSNLGLEVLDLRTLTNIVQVASYVTAGPVWDVKVVGDRAYVACGADSGCLHVLDVSNPSQVSPLGRYDANRAFFAVTVVGTTAYVAAHSEGLHILDVTDPNRMKRLGGYDTPGYAYDVAVSGAYAYVADEFAGVHVLDVSNPITVEKVGSFDPKGFAYAVQVFGTNVCLADGVGRLYVLDASNSTNLVALGSYDSSGVVYAVRASGRYAYVANGAAGIEVLDVYEPDSIRRVGGYNTPGEALGIDIMGAYAFVADGSSGLQVFDVHDPTRVVQVGSYDTGEFISSSASAIHATESKVYVADYNAGLRIYDATNPANLVRLGGLDALFSFTQVQVVGSRAYLVGNGGSELQVMDVSNPTNIMLLGSHVISDFPLARIHVVGRYAYVAVPSMDFPGLQVLDVSDPAINIPVGGYASAGQPTATSAAGG